MTMREGEAYKFKADSAGEVVCDLIHEDGSVEKNVRIRFPAGHRSMPKDTSATDGHDMVSSQSGRLLEVLAVSVRKVTQALDKIKKLVTGESQFYSVGDNPNGISLVDDKFLIGLRADKAAARTGDEVTSGTITIVVAASPTPAPNVTITITYQDNGKNPATPVVVGPFVLLGTFGGMMGPGTYTFNVKGKIGPGSQLVFIE